MKNRTTKNWMEEELTKFSMKKTKQKQTNNNTRKKVKMSRLSKAGLFFLR